VRRVERRLLYTSPALPPGLHSLSIVVAPASDARYERGYVNVERIDVLGRPG